MNQRLQQFLAAENLSQSQFADKIGVARAGVSHILAGRNRPGFDFIENMARHFPTLNLEWLILGKGKMYKTSSEITEPEILPSFNQEASNAIQETEIFPSVEKVQYAAKENVVLSQQTLSDNTRIGKVLVLFNDGTFQELK